jgi:hypothetical protein
MKIRRGNNHVKDRGKKRKIQNRKVKYLWSNAVLAKKQNVTEPMVSMLKIIEF